MRKFIVNLILITIVVIIALPAVIVHGGWDFFHRPVVSYEEVGVLVKMYCHEKEQVMEIPMDEYLVGVIAAEMPAKFPMEALKAQAVAARTYTTKRVNSLNFVNSHHPEAHVCDDPNHSQAYLTKEEMRERWGVINYYRYYNKIADAVKETKGVIITHSGQLIDPVYHASCGGKATENSEDVWKFKIPYLRSVSCPENLNQKTAEKEEKVFTLAQLDQALGTSLNVLPAQTGASASLSEDIFRPVEKSPTGRLKKIQIGEETFEASLIREKLGLRSTMIDWQVVGDKVAVTTQGYGHGVGMCQEGAAVLAQQGKTYEEIIKHYYTGVELTKMK